jgi:hypothetical protein
LYALHKIMAGLLDRKTYADNRQALAIRLWLAMWVDEWTAAWRRA